MTDKEKREELEPIVNTVMGTFVMITGIRTTSYMLQKRLDALGIEDEKVYQYVRQITDEVDRLGKLNSEVFKLGSEIFDS